MPLDIDGAGLPNTLGCWTIHMVQARQAQLSVVRCFSHAVLQTLSILQRFCIKMCDQEKELMQMDLAEFKLRF